MIGPVGSKSQPTAEEQGPKDANRSSPVGIPLSSAVPRLPKAGEGKEEAGAADSPGLRAVPQEQGEASSFSAQRVNELRLYETRSIQRQYVTMNGSAIPLPRP